MLTHFLLLAFLATVVISVEGEEVEGAVVTAYSEQVRSSIAYPHKQGYISTFSAVDQSMLRAHSSVSRLVCGVLNHQVYILCYSVARYP